MNPCLVLVQPRKGAQWLGGRVLDSRPRGRGFETQWRHCLVSLGRKESNQTNKSTQEDRPDMTEKLLTGT